MESDERTRFFMVGNLKIMLHSKWQGFHYANRKGAAGWSLMLGFVHFYGDKQMKGIDTN